MPARRLKRRTRKLDLTIPASLHPSLPRRPNEHLPVEFVEKVRTKYYAPVLVSTNLMASLIEAARSNAQAVDDAEWHAIAEQTVADMQNGCAALRGLPAPCPPPLPKAYESVLASADRLDKVVKLLNQYLDGADKKKLVQASTALGQAQELLVSAGMTFLKPKAARVKSTKSQRPSASAGQRRRA